jgi:hypothetical protein
MADRDDGLCIEVYGKHLSDTNPGSRTAKRRLRIR